MLLSKSKDSKVTARQSTGESGASSEPLWRTLEWVTASATVRESLIDKISNIISIENKLSTFLTVGFNSSSRSLEKGTAAVLLMGKDCKRPLLDALSELAIVKKVPVVMFSSLSKKLGEKLKLKSCACMIIYNESYVSSFTVEKNGESNSTRRLAPLFDDLRDFLLSHANNNHAFRQL